MIFWRITISHDMNNHLKINFVKFDYIKRCKVHFLYKMNTFFVQNEYFILLTKSWLIKTFFYVFLNCCNTNVIFTNLFRLLYKHFIIFLTTKEIDFPRFKKSRYCNTFFSMCIYWNIFLHPFLILRFIK